MPLPKRPQATTSPVEPPLKRSAALPEVEVSLPPTPPRLAPKPIATAPPAPHELSAAEEAEGWRYHAKTGKKYREIPPAEYIGDEPVLHLTDLDLNDLGGEADKFLPHLRVAPDKKEQEAIKKARLRRESEQNRVYDATNEDFKEEPDEAAAPEEEPKKSFLQRLLGR